MPERVWRAISAFGASELRSAVARSAAVALARAVAVPPVLVLAAALAAPGVPHPARAQLRDQTQIVPTNDLPNPYVRVEPWGEVPRGGYDERAAFIGAEEGPAGRIYVLHRCLGNSCAGRPEPPVLALDANGRLLASWGEGLMDFPHGLAVDREGNVWAADHRAHQV